MTKASQPTAAPAIYHLRIELRDVEPPVWRRVAVPRDISLAQLHGVIQAAMDWHDLHLHHFSALGSFYGPTREDDADGGLLDERDTRLDRILPGARRRMDYLYDFADRWRHAIVVERIEPADGGGFRCLDGRRAAPPDGCGGPEGYADLLRAMADAAHPGHADAVERYGGGFDPERFDAESVNRRMRKG
jgi:hypothetical protein